MSMQTLAIKRAKMLLQCVTQIIGHSSAMFDTHTTISKPNRKLMAHKKHKADFLWAVFLAYGLSKIASGRLRSLPSEDVAVETQYHP